MAGGSTTAVSNFDEQTVITVPHCYQQVALPPVACGMQVMLCVLSG
jgi:hypothetical protein